MKDFLIGFAIGFTFGLAVWYVVQFAKAIFSGGI